MELLKYHNDINKLKLGIFTEVETDIFFSLLLKVKDTNTNIFTIELEEIKNIIEIKNRSQERFIKSILNLNLKLKTLAQTVELPNGDYKTFSLFDDILTSPRRKVIEIQINKTFKYLIDGLIGNFTIFDLKELVNLKGNYAKTLFRLLKQWESKKEYYVKMEEFRNLMGIPQDYKMGNIDQKVLNPCIKELSPLFEGLKIEKIKKGVRIDKLRFTWKDKKRAQTEKAIKGAKELFNKAIADKKTLEVEKEVQELEKQEQKPLKQNTIIQREKITSKAYESKYKEYLKVLGVEHNTFVRKSFDIINKPLYEIIEDTENKIKIKPQEIKTKYQEFLNKYDCDDNPIMKKAFDEILEKEYIIDLS